MDCSRFVFPVDGKGGLLTGFDPGDTGAYQDKKEAKADLKAGIKQLVSLQDKLYAYDKYAVLIVLQAMDAAGKDGIIKHVMSGINPQGCRVVSFKAPSNKELDHDFLWRCVRDLPARGNFGIFNRSYYEEVLVTKVHPDILEKQQLPGYRPGIDMEKFWNNRYDDINSFEHHLVRNGTIVLKFFLHLSKEEQRQRFLARIENPDKNWKFSSADLRERGYWDEYQSAFQAMLQHTSTNWAPWYVIPADNKWFSRVSVCDVLVQTLESLNLHYPRVKPKQRAEIEKAKKELMGK
jgi:PPK2 family polyphosphate:nucleotide phosphotransferase